ncbi:nucleotide exchange factor GrpE [candidate division WOR-3 bacterium]|nr:nucleotide exchange factor GrpE [candidate division WOR-3 bacterium]
MEKKGPVTRLKEEVVKKDEEIKTFKDRYLRALADLDNYRKRMEREYENMRQYSQVEFFRKIIPVLDSFDRAVNDVSTDSNTENYAQGVEMIYRQLRDTLRSMGLEEFSSLGEIFDPARHEAVATVVSDDKPENTVVEEVSKGYVIRDRIIKPAKVLVSKQDEGGNKDVEDNRD